MIALLLAFAIHVAPGESIQKAIDALPASGGEVVVAPGVYREVLEIAKPGVTLRGESADASKTMIVFDKSAGTAGGTFKSATVHISGDGFVAKNITFANDWNRTHEQVRVGSQAVAVGVTADKAVFRNVRMLGNQDTLYAAKGRQYFENCYIEGNVDFIFGDANAFFENCELHSVVYKNGGYITAQSKNSAAQESTYVFDHCKVTGAPGQKRVYLGRPWRPYATVVFLNTAMGEHIEAAGWREWHPGETASLGTAFYAEYNSTGPGATGKREPHTHLLTQEEAAKYTRRSIFKDWVPTGSKQ